MAIRKKRRVKTVPLRPVRRNDQHVSWVQADNSELSDIDRRLAAEIRVIADLKSGRTTEPWIRKLASGVE